MKITVPEAARRCGKNPETVRRWIREGKLRSEKIGTQHLVEVDELDDFVNGDDMAELPPEWRTTYDGKPMPNWVRLVRQSRNDH